MPGTVDLEERLEQASAEFLALRLAVEAGSPWPISDVIGTESEAYWGPPEVLAHVAEMVPFWQGEIARILDGVAEPVPFGRVATDSLRIGVIERDRSLPPGELFERIDAAVVRFAGPLRTLTIPQASRRGLHPTLGEMTVAQIADRFVVSHLEDHVRQLSTILTGDGTPPAPRA
jgi:hypothetical protein